MQQNVVRSMVLEISNKWKLRNRTCRVQHSNMLPCEHFDSLRKPTEILQF